MEFFARVFLQGSSKRGETKRIKITKQEANDGLDDPQDHEAPHYQMCKNLGPPARSLANQYVLGKLDGKSNFAHCSPYLGGQWNEHGKY